VNSRRFPPPWSVEEQEACFVVREAATDRRQRGEAVRPDAAPNVMRASLMS